MNLELIVIGPKPARLLRYAAAELARYTQQLFNNTPRIVSRQQSVTGVTIILNAQASGVSDQGYILQPIDQRTFAIDGGSPVAVMWGVYDLVERWGVRYELHGDMRCERPGPIRLPSKPVKCEPDLKLRSFRTYNDFATCECLWPAKDYRLLINQLAKLRFNAILFCVRPYDPFIDLRFRGARKTLAAPNYGWMPQIKQDDPGYSLFVESGDARRGAFANPDLVGQRTHAEAIAAGQAYARKVFRMAHARGMQCLVTGYPADFDPAIRRRISELTLPQHKAKRAPIYRVRYGIWREGPDIETGRCMSVSNPVFLDAIAANIQAHLDAFPDADAFFFASTEFGGSDANCERAWKALDRNYGLSKIKTLPALQREARRYAEGDPDRSERKLRSDIVILYALDKLINERGFNLSKARRGATVAPAGLSPELHRFLPKILPHGTLYYTSYGYAPTYVATRTNTMRHKDADAVRHLLVISAEDDNVGMVPQLPGPALLKIMESLREVRACGLQTRQWMHSKCLTTFHYLAHAAWEKGWTPRKAYRHLYEPICGPKAMPHVLRAFGHLERITERMHSEMFCVSFSVPRWITGHWENWPKSHTPQRLEHVAAAYQQAADDLVKAIRVSRRAGHDNLFALERQVRHAVYYCRALAELSLARAAEDLATVAQGSAEHEETTDVFVGAAFDELDAARTAVTEHLDNAESLMRQACEVFAQGVRDRCDLGALATLNSYNLDVIAALARIARAKKEMFSCLER